MRSESERAVVFVHGLLGFDKLALPGDDIYYFRGLPDFFAHHPLPVFFPAQPAVSSIRVRAEVLASHLKEIPARKIYLIGHSMGGLDSRYLIHHLDPEHRVRALVTIGTPHHGTPLADWILRTSNPVEFLGRLILPHALADLTPEACARFNQEIPDRTDVAYSSHAGARDLSAIPLPFRPWARRLDEAAGDNDCLVPVDSARWGRFGEILRADHFEQVGWSLAPADAEIGRPFDHYAFYQGLLDGFTGRPVQD